MFIIAEIGINHNGYINIAKQLIKVAKDAGCDAVKFQKRTIDICYTKEFLDSPRESPFGKTQREQKEALEFGRKEYDEIDRYCKEIGIEWFASAWDIPSIEFLDKYNSRYQKVASPMITNIPFLEELAKRGKHTFLSTGIATEKMIDRAYKIFWNKCPVTLFHCVSEYPLPEDKMNLSYIPKLKSMFPFSSVGYSGHETGLSTTYYAAALGATYIERHITLDKAMYGSDQAASLDPQGLRLLVGGLKKLDIALGDGEKVITEQEKINAKKMRYWE